MFGAAATVGPRGLRSTAVCAAQSSVETHMADRAQI